MGSLGNDDDDRINAMRDDNLIASNENTSPESRAASKRVYAAQDLFLAVWLDELPKLNPSQVAEHVGVFGSAMIGIAKVTRT